MEVIRICKMKTNKNYEKFNKKLKEVDDTVYEYNIKYISTKLYKKETIAFVELYNVSKDTFYVVKDNKREDIVFFFGFIF